MHVTSMHGDEFPDLVNVTVIVLRVRCLDCGILGKALCSHIS
jgi:hypothetical protein